ncbi:NAD-dependent protein deacylase [Cohnella silvisoli]|uniref:protein acetyllysine N-acetyltransferase n=1 Tax=Cohnella silvisoli TaxID=2873699 RepID=A0ABV1KXE4_9BACL|nr:NAD-dependent protein deacylase [Cohnella silvisoli]MCD9024168.1 NAD-dependent protein deacylase [Cohnella silvisoli]
MNFSELKRTVQESDNIVFFGGAGTSTESGIPDFRSADGYYYINKTSKYTPEEILSRNFFLEHTEEFYQFYKKQMIYPNANYNPGHEALVELEFRGQLKAIITQNIDGLHQMAGSRNVLELHGSIQRNHCMNCGTSYSLKYVLNSMNTVPECQQCTGIIKPDVVLYQEELDTKLLQNAKSYIAEAEVLIVAGTSLTVQPAAGLIRHYSGDKFILINKSATPFDGIANFIIPDRIAKVLAALISHNVD